MRKHVAVSPWLVKAEAAGEHGCFQLGEGEDVSKVRSKALRELAACAGGRLWNKAGFRVYSQVLELICSGSVRLILFSVMVKDWNRGLKIRKIFTAAKLLDLLASISGEV